MNKLKFVIIGFFWFLPLFGNIKVAITVDDLPTHGKLPPGISREDVAKKMLSILKKYKVPEVYGFTNAGKVEQKNESLEVLKLWREAGYPLGNHAYLHQDLHKVSISEFQQEIVLNEPLLKKLNGNLDYKYFRYPFLREGDSLEKRNAIRKFLKEHEYKIAQVTIDFEDWSWNDRLTSEVGIGADLPNYEIKEFKIRRCRFEKV